ISKEGEVLVEGARVGQLEGLRFIPDALDGIDPRLLVAAAGRVLRNEIAARARLLAADSDEAFAVESGGALLWRGAVVGRLVGGGSPPAPPPPPLPRRFLPGGPPPERRRPPPEVVPPPNRRPP